MSARTERAIRNVRGPLALCLVMFWTLPGFAQLPPELVEKLNHYPHATTVSQSEREVKDHEIGLGAMRKSRGVWKFKDSERQSGILHRQTWQIIDGFTSLEVFLELVAQLEGIASSELLFACEGRSCGQGVQWANRVFMERILYGREEMQRYRVYSLSDPEPYRIILYSSARSADRQYLHMETLRLGGQSQQSRVEESLGARGAHGSVLFHARLSRRSSPEWSLARIRAVPRGGRSPPSGP